MLGPLVNIPHTPNAYVELVFNTLDIALDKIVGVSFFPRQSPTCSARGNVAAEGTAPDKKYMKVESVQRPVSKRSAQGLRKHFLYRLFFPGPPIKNVPMSRVYFQQGEGSM